MSTTVTVGCKLPNGLLLELGKRGDEKYRSVTLKGANSSAIVGGYGITEGVDKDFMDAWLKKHQWLPAVRKGLVFVEDSVANAQAHAVEFMNEKTGLERLNPNDAPKGITPDPDHMQQLKRDASELRMSASA